MSTVVFAPAKINLFLHVTGRRPDGYHELQTVFQFLDFGDTITLSPRADGALRRAPVAGAGPLARLPEDQDLAIRAARLLQAASGTGLGAGIAVDKRIPLGAGLGGGSSDAAAALVGLDRLWGLGLSRHRLAELGLRLGADVPVFVHGRAAWAEGVGEVLSPLDLEEPWYLLLDPRCHVPTAEVFGDPALTRNSAPMKISDLPAAGLAGRTGRVSVRRLLESARNDCEEVVRRRFPEVDAALRWLAGFGPARMTGTGACVFAPFSERDEARAVLERVPPRWRGLVARGMNRSPLADPYPQP